MKQFADIKRENKDVVSLEECCLQELIKELAMDLPLHIYTKVPETLSEEDKSIPQDYTNWRAGTYTAFLTKGSFNIIDMCEMEEIVVMKMSQICLATCLI